MLIEFEVKIELAVRLFIRLSLERLEQFLDAVSGECRLAKDTHDFKHRSANLEVVLNDGDETVRDDGNVYLYPDSILGLTPETLDLKVLLDPLEEDLHLPPVLVELRNVLCAEIEVISVIYKTPVKLRYIIDDTSDDSGVLLLILLLGKADTLVAQHIVGAIKHTLPIDNLIVGMTLLPDNEECTGQVDSVESCKVKVSSVKHIAGQGIVCEPVHGVDIMHIGVCDSVEDRYLRGDVNLRVNPDAGLGASELRPSEHGHAEVDGCGVDSIKPAMQLKLLSDTLGLCDGDHVESELLKDAVVPECIGLRQHLSVDRLTAKTEVLGFLSMGYRDICKFPEASASDELTEHQHQHVAPVRHRPSLGPVVVLGQDAPEMPLWKELGYLGENELSYVHICSDFESDANVRFSKPGQGMEKLKRCA